MALAEREQQFTAVELKNPNITLQEIYAAVGTWPDTSSLPIVYHRYYNVTFFGFETWSKMDAWKLDRIFQLLVEKELLREDEHGSPLAEISREILSLVHSEAYLDEVESSKMTVMRMTELQALFLVPNSLIQKNIVSPLKFQAAGTVLALGLALERGWAINLGGGMIHACHDRGAGWCPYDDLTLALRYARHHTTRVKKAMIIDLGAHQGNGYQHNKLHFEDEDLFIVDVYNEVIFPHDIDARAAIDVERRLSCGASSEDYMSAVTSALDEASSFDPDVILYSAGTNVWEGDFSGQFHVKREDVLLRDQMVFKFAFEKRVPICMVVSSGYGKMNFELVAESIDAVVKHFNLSC